MGREKYFHRTRYLYALRFPGRQCYIGQTCDPQRRFGEHRRAWHDPFEPLVLGTVDATFAEAEIYERAYRCLAHQAGWAIRFDPHQPWATLNHLEPVKVKGLSLPRSMKKPHRLAWLFWIVVVVGLVALVIKSCR